MEEVYYLSEVKVGQKVENFVANALTPDGNFKEISLKDNLNAGQWTILFFWPADFTVVCPTEVMALSESYQKFVDLNTEIYGISTDSIHTHLAWTKADSDIGGIGNINFPLLEDRNHLISEQFGVLDAESGNALRGLFIISPDGILEHSTINNVNVGRSVDETLRTLSAFQSGGLCPINWKKDDKTL